MKFILLLTSILGIMLQNVQCSDDAQNSLNFKLQVRRILSNEKNSNISRDWKLVGAELHGRIQEFYLYSNEIEARLEESEALSIRHDSNIKLLYAIMLSNFAYVDSSNTPEFKYFFNILTRSYPLAGDGKSTEIERMLLVKSLMEIKAVDKNYYHRALKSMQARLTMPDLLPIVCLTYGDEEAELLSSQEIPDSLMQEAKSLHLMTKGSTEFEQKKEGVR